MTVWSTVLRVTRRRSTPAHSDTFVLRDYQHHRAGPPTERAATPRREGAGTRNKDDFATASSIGPTVSQSNEI